MKSIIEKKVLSDKSEVFDLIIDNRAGAKITIGCTDEQAATALSELLATGATFIEVDAAE